MNACRRPTPARVLFAAPARATPHPPHRNIARPPANPATPPQTHAPPCSDRSCSCAVPHMPAAPNSFCMPAAFVFLCRSPLSALLALSSGSEQQRETTRLAMRCAAGRLAAAGGGVLCQSVGLSASLQRVRQGSGHPAGLSGCAGVGGGSPPAAHFLFHPPFGPATLCTCKLHTPVCTCSFTVTLLQSTPDAPAPVPHDSTPMP